MKRYLVINQITKRKKMIQATSIQQACRKAGWVIRNCVIYRGTK